MISVNLTTISFKIEYINIIAYFLIMWKSHTNLTHPVKVF